MSKPITLVVCIEKGTLDELRSDLASFFRVEVIDFDTQDEEEERDAKERYALAVKRCPSIIYP